MTNPTALTDTIAAIATAVVPAQGSVGIVRVSGSQALTIAQQLFQPARDTQWQSHQMRYGWIQDLSGQKVDEGLVVWMQAPRSYTCEDVVEFQCHGGVMIVQAILQLCLKLGARLAEPGEFTLRAFLNGRIDLTQAESVLDVIKAHSPEAAKVALAGLQGHLAQPIAQMREQLIQLLADLEARLDFEDDLPPLDLEVWTSSLDQAYDEIKQLLSTAHRGQLLRTGLKVAIVGQPNVGKSSLLNAWSGQDRAIVTDLPGTTRDVIDSQLVVRGLPIHVLDTAGIRHTDDQVEQLGVERSYQMAHEADIIVFVIDAALGWTGAEDQLYQRIQNRPIILVINKMDLVQGAPIKLPVSLQPQVCMIANQQQGISDLEAAVETLAYQGTFQPSTTSLTINQRQQAALLRSQASLEQVKTSIQLALPLDFWTIDLRGAIQALGEITGHEVTESVLDRIFSQFCIGK